MASVDKMSDRELLESMNTKMAVHEAQHEIQDVLITKIAGAIWGNGKVGLTAKMYLIMTVLGVVSVAVVAVLADILLRHGA